MGLLNGSASVTRCIVTSQPDEPDFESAAFKEIEAGSSVRERIGFLPFEPGVPYRIGQHRLAFRLRIDRLKADPTAVQERLKEMIRAECDATGQSFIRARRKREFRHLAEEELIVRSTPRSKVIECCIDGSTLYIGSTANAYLGMVLGLLASIDVLCDFRAPWSDHGDNDVESELVEVGGPGEAILGCRFLRALLKDNEVIAEPESGAIRLRTADANVSLTGGVQNELLRYLEQRAEFLAAKLMLDDFTFRLDGLRYRIAGLRLETEKHDSWVDLLDERLELIAALFDRLDAKYGELRDKLCN